MLKLTHVISVAAVALLAGCEEPVDVDCSQFQGRYLDLAQGRSWSYRITDQSGVRVKTQSVGPLEDVGGEKAGTMAFRLTTEKGGGTVLSWQEDTGDKVLRHREQDMSGTTMTDEYYVANRTRLDETPPHIIEGATWVETFNEIIINDALLPPLDRVEFTKTWNWTVELVDEPLEVPAGSFCALRVRRTNPADIDSDKTFWYARGIGKIKERADNGAQLEELVAFTR